MTTETPMTDSQRTPYYVLMDAADELQQLADHDVNDTYRGCEVLKATADLLRQRANRAADASDATLAALRARLETLADAMKVCGDAALDAVSMCTVNEWEAEIRALLADGRTTP